MKKLLLAALFVLFCTPESYSQNAKLILGRYIKETKIHKIKKSKPKNYLIDASASVLQSGFSLGVDAKAIYQDSGSKMRAEIVLLGQGILIVVDGDNGWMKTTGKSQTIIKIIPSEQIADIRDQLNSFEKSTWRLKTHSFKCVGEENGQYIVVVKDRKDPSKEYTTKFNKKTALMESITFNLPTLQLEGAVAELSDYKRFGKVKLPTLIKIVNNGNVVGTLKINDFQLKYPTQKQMFAEPN